MSDARIEVIPLDRLRSDPSNARKRTDANRKAIRDSMRKFGPARSILIDGKDIVRAGNGTLEGASAEGITEVLVVEPEPGQLVAVRRRFATETEAAAYGIADNRSAELAEWDDDVLARTLEAIRTDQTVPIESTGYTDAQVDALLEEAAREVAGPLGGDGSVPLGDSSSPPQALEYLKFGESRVPLTADELSALAARLEAHIEECGTPYGFVGSLLDV